METGDIFEVVAVARPGQTCGSFVCFANLQLQPQATAVCSLATNFLLAQCSRPVQLLRLGRGRTKGQRRERQSEVERFKLPGSDRQQQHDS